MPAPRDPRSLEEQLQLQLQLYQQRYQKELDTVRLQYRNDLRQARQMGQAQVDQVYALHLAQLRHLRTVHADEVRQLRRNYRDQIESIRAEEQSRQLRSLAHRQIATALISQTVQTGQGLFNRGYTGTVLEAQMTYELKLLGRELVAVFSPLVRMLKQIVQSLRTWMQSLGEAGQNVLMFGGLAVMAARMLMTIGMAQSLGRLGLAGGVALLASGASMAGGMPGWLGAAAGLGLGYGWRSMMAGGAAASLAGLRTAGSLGGLGGMLRGGLRFAGKIAWPLALLDIGTEAATGGYYTELRARGHSKATAVAGAVGGGFMDFLSTPLKWVGVIDKTYGEAFRERMGSGTGTGPFSTKDALTEFLEGGKRRTEAISGAGFDQLGAGYDAVSMAISRVQSPSEKYLAEIRDMLKEAVVTVTKPPPPPISAATPRP